MDSLEGNDAIAERSRGITDVKEEWNEWNGRRTIKGQEDGTQRHQSQSDHRNPRKVFPSSLPVHETLSFKSTSTFSTILDGQENSGTCHDQTSPRTAGRGRDPVSFLHHQQDTSPRHSFIFFHIILRENIATKEETKKIEEEWKIERRRKKGRKQSGSFGTVDKQNLKLLFSLTHIYSRSPRPCMIIPKKNDFPDHSSVLFLSMFLIF